MKKIIILYLFIFYIITTSWTSYAEDKNPYLNLKSYLKDVNLYDAQQLTEEDKRQGLQLIEEKEKYELYKTISSKLIPKIEQKSGKDQEQLAENSIGANSIKPDMKVVLSLEMSKDFSDNLNKNNKYSLSDILESISIRVYNEGQKADLLTIKYSNKPSENEQQLSTTDFILQNCNPFNLGLDWKEIIDGKTLFSITLKFSENTGIIKTYYGRLYRPCYLEFIGVSAFYLTDTKRFPQISFNDFSTILSTSNISLGFWLLRVNLQAEILGLNKISIALPTLYQIMNNDALGLKAGVGIGFNIFIEKFTIGFGYDLTNSKGNDPIIQILIGADLLSLFTINGSTKNQ